MLRVRLSIFSLLATLVCCLGSIEATVAADAKLYHTKDKKHLSVSIKESILHAEKSILIFAFSLSDSEIIAALNQKANEGLKVTVVIDRDHLGEIMSHRVPSIEIVTRATGEGHLHHKILVIDEKEIWIGSANFTKSAYETQENLMVRFVSAELAQYLNHEADVFRKNSYRSEHGPLPISLLNQEIYFCLLPHDGFPPKKIEKSINDQSKQILIEKINQANTSIHIAMMVWTNNDLANAVIQAHKRGIKVQVVAPDFGGNFLTLLSAGIEVKVNPKLSFMHNKLMCIDHNILVNGSANWSQSSFTRSDESFVIVEPMTSDQSEVFIEYWNHLYGVPIQE
ncbi:putative cardiolipin synthetase [Chlamydiales bacterium STE3]|nr:putative cardiolipin synthetase [Chlamydiales bacterium STE3]